MTSIFAGAEMFKNSGMIVKTWFFTLSVNLSDGQFFPPISNEAAKPRHPKLKTKELFLVELALYT